MAEEKKEAVPAVEKKPSLIKKLIPVVVVVIVAAGGGLAAYKFWLQPRLEVEDAEATPEEEKIPETAQTFAFEDFMVTVLQPDKTKPAPLLLFSVSFLCADEETHKLVERDKDYFRDMLSKLHSYKNREELDNPLLKESIKKEALKLANERLRKLQLEPNEEIKILDVLHPKWTVVDQQ